MRKFAIGILFTGSGLALIACTRLITEELPTQPFGGPAVPGAPLPVGTPVPVRPAPTPTPTVVPTPQPTPGPTPTPSGTPAPGPTPDPRTTACVPAPPQMARLNVHVHNDQGEKKVLDSAPIVCSGPDFENYCQTIMNDVNRRCCPPRPEGHPQRPACDELLMGRAGDSGRVGPTWSVNGQPCSDSASTTLPRCVNHPTDQFLLFSYGKGTFQACSESGVCGQIKIE